MEQYTTTPHNRKLHAVLLITLLLLFLFVYNRVALLNLIHPQEPVIVNSPNLMRSNNPWNQYHADSCASIVMDGDLVVRSGADAISALFIKANSHDKSYSHAGIVFIENGYPMVYDAIATAENPHAEVSRDSLKNFINPFNNTGYAVYRYQLNKPEIRKFHEVMMGYYRDRIKFDAHFDLETDSLLYCSEIVYKALNKVTNQNKYLNTTKAGAFEYVAIDDLYLKKGIKMICKIIYKQ